MIGKRLHVIAGAGAALVLSGCMSLAPRYERPTAPVAATFPLAAANEAGTPASALPWRSFFAEPRLQRLIELALANNRDLRVAVANIELSAAQLGARRADLYPPVNAGFSGQVIFSPLVPPNYRIQWQSLTVGTSAACTSGITVRSNAP